MPHCSKSHVVAHIDLLSKQMNCMKVLPIYCYNDDDNDLMMITTKKQRTQIFFSLQKGQKTFTNAKNTSERMLEYTDHIGWSVIDTVACSHTEISICR